MNKFYLSITIVLENRSKVIDQKCKYLHKIIVLPFPPFKDLRIESATKEWEVTLKDMVQLTYTLSEENENGVFHYTDIVKCDDEKEKSWLSIKYSECGWLPGNGYEFKL